MQIAMVGGGMAAGEENKNRRRGKNELRGEITLKTGKMAVKMHLFGLQRPPAAKLYSLGKK